MPGMFNAGDLHIDPDGQDEVRHLEHLDRPFIGANITQDALEGAAAGALYVTPPTPQALAEQYLREVAPLYGISDRMLPVYSTAVGLVAHGEPESDTSALQLAEEKQVMGTTTIVYQQMYHHLPVWEAGVSVMILPQPMRVVASQSSIHRDVTLAEGFNNGAFPAEPITTTALARYLGVRPGDLTMNSSRQLIYRYDKDRRLDPAPQAPYDEALQEGLPTLPLPPVPATIQDGQHYVVTEVLFTLAAAGDGSANWRAFIEENSGTVLYLRGCVA